jgi:hypothetical protein
VTAILILSYIALAVAIGVGYAICISIIGFPATAVFIVSTNAIARREKAKVRSFGVFRIRNAAGTEQYNCNELGGAHFCHPFGQY